MASVLVSQPAEFKSASMLTGTHTEGTFQCFDVPEEQRKKILAQRASGHTSVPRLHVDTLKYRRGPNADVKDVFRGQLLHELRQRWSNPDTEVQFLKLAGLLETEGCALFTDLIGTSRFEKFVQDYDAIQKRSGSHSFLHSYVNLTNDLNFVENPEYNDVFVHPLLVALVAYCMGGAVRVIDTRGKDTEPVFANAQDNMLHIDNTPFHKEYKVLVIWKRGEARGPSGQNFTFIPGTHRGNRGIYFNDSGAPFSTERENLFGSHEAIDGLFEFQEKMIGCRTPTVIEVEYPEKPLSVLFEAGALVHHRYRTQSGDPRSCMSAAFHLISDNPGVLVPTSKHGTSPATLLDFLIRDHGSRSNEAFLGLLSATAGRIEAKVAEIHKESGAAQIVDTAPMTLSNEELHAWRNVVVTSPSASSIKFHHDVYVSDAVGRGDEQLIANLVTSMMYDKHGLLQLILYPDGSEETRKLARKHIGEMDRKTITARLVGWLPTLLEGPFAAEDLPSPEFLGELAEKVATVGAAQLKLLEQRNESHANRAMLASLLRLILDLGEALGRCELPETYASTSLYLFWASDDIAQFLENNSKQEILGVASVLLRNYVAYVLLLEAELKLA